MAHASSSDLSVFISFDIEGVTGVSTWSVQGTAAGRDFDRFRRISTAEVNAAVEGALEAGATRIVVADGHGDGQNLIIDELHPKASLIQAWPRPLMMMDGIDRGFSACAFIGYHCKEGAASAILAHTMSPMFFDVRIDGVCVGELDLNARIAAEAGVPLVFLSGDEAICSEAKALDPEIETVAAKRPIGFYAAEMRNPKEVAAEIREGMKRALLRPRPQTKAAPEPVELEICFKQVLSAEVASNLLGATRVDGRTVRFSAPSVSQAVRHIGALQLINRLDR